MALTILCASFTLLLLLGVPVAFSIGLSSLATILYEGLPLAVGFQQMISGMNPFSFLAIPFFIFAGEIMLYGGVADRIIAFAKAVAGHVRGGLGMALTVGVEDGALHFRSRYYFAGIGPLRLRIPDLLTPGRAHVMHQDRGGGTFLFSMDFHHPWLGRTLFQEGLFRDPIQP